MPEILIVEDDHTLSMALELSLGDMGHKVNTRRTLAGAREFMTGGSADLVVLDLGLPDGDGLDYCRELRTGGFYAPVLILTARGTLAARVEGLSAGADDYVTKPFELPELMARVEALIRRQSWQKPGEQVLIGALQVDFERREAAREGQPIDLTDLELKLLRYLLERAGEPVSREDILTTVWGLSPSTRTRTVDVFISRLRRHIEPNSAKPRFLVNVRGVGYRLRLDG
jgi:DNA-binding response OmpR family regulator